MLRALALLLLATGIAATVYRLLNPSCPRERLGYDCNGRNCECRRKK